MCAVFTRFSRGCAWAALKLWQVKIHFRRTDRLVVVRSLNASGDKFLVLLKVFFPPNSVDTLAVLTVGVKHRC